MQVQATFTGRPNSTARSHDPTAILCHYLMDCSILTQDWTVQERNTGGFINPSSSLPKDGIRWRRIYKLGEKNHRRENEISCGRRFCSTDMTRSSENVHGSGHGAELLGDLREGRPNRRVLRPAPLHQRPPRRFAPARDLRPQLSLDYPP